MDKPTEVVLKAIIRGIAQAAPDSGIPQAITQALFQMHEELAAAHMPAESHDVGRMAEYARDTRFSN